MPGRPVRRRRLSAMTARTRSGWSASTAAVTMVKRRCDRSLLVARAITARFCAASRSLGPTKRRPRQPFLSNPASRAVPTCRDQRVQQGRRFADGDRLHSGRRAEAKRGGNEQGDDGHGGHQGACPVDRPSLPCLGPLCFVRSITGLSASTPDEAQRSCRRMRLHLAADRAAARRPSDSVSEASSCRRERESMQWWQSKTMGSPGLGLRTCK